MSGCGRWVRLLLLLLLLLWVRRLDEKLVHVWQLLFTAGVGRSGRHVGSSRIFYNAVRRVRRERSKGLDRVGEVATDGRRRGRRRRQECAGRVDGTEGERACRSVTGDKVVEPGGEV